MSKKQINNRLDKLFDGIKEEEKAIEKAPRPKAAPSAPSAKKPLKRDLTPPSFETQEGRKTEHLAVEVEVSDSYATMSLPLHVDTELWGTLQIVDDKPKREWDLEEQMLLQQVTDQLELALENARLFQETQRRTEELALVNKIVTQVSSSLNIQDNLHYIAEEVAEISAAPRVGIMLLNKEKTDLILAADYPKTPADLGTKIAVEGNPSSIRVLETLQPLSIQNVQTDPLTASIKDVMKARGTKSLVIFPLLAGNEAIGTLGIGYNDVSTTLTQNKIDLIQAILIQTSTSIETSRFFEETQLSEERARVIVQNAPEAIVLIDMDTGLFVEPNDNALRLYGLDKEEILKVGAADLSPPKQPNGRASAEMAMEKIQIALKGGAPIFDWTHLHSSGDEVFCEIRLVQLPDATRTLIRASVVDIAERKYNELLQTAVSNISNAALAAQDMQELMHKVHQIVGTLMPADNFYIALYDEVRDMLTFPYHVDERDPEQGPRKPGRGLTGYVLQSGQPLLAIGENLSNLIDSGEIELIGTKGTDWLGVPLESGGKPIGVMAVQSYDPKIKLTKKHRDTLAFVANQVSSALDSKQSELELRALFSAMEDVIFVVDQDTRYLRIAPTNPAGLYRPPEELLGKRMDELLPEETHILFRDAIQEALESDKTVNIEYSLEIDRQEVWFYASLSKLAENQVYWVARDITERKQAELQIQQLGNAVEQSLDGMAIAGMDGNIQFVNHAWSDMHGYATTDELIGEPLSIFHSKKQLKNEVEPFNEIVGAEGSNQGEVGHRRQDGSTFPTWMTVSILKSDDDTPLALVASAQDITERKKSEEALQEAHARIQFILNSTSVPTHITNMAGTFLYANQAVADTLHLPLDEILGTKAGRFYFSAEELETFNIDMKKHGVLINVENRYLRGDGEMFWGLSSSRVFEYEGEEALLSTVLDITDRKKTETVLQRQNEYMAAAAEVGRLVTSTLDTGILFRRAVNLLREHFGYYHAAIFTAEEAGDGLSVIVREATGEAGEEMKKSEHAIEIGSKSVVGMATESGEPYIINDVSKDPNHQLNPLLPETKAEAAVPLKIGRRLIGALDLQATEIDAFSPEDITVLQLLADQFATAIDNARSYKLAQDAFFEMRELEKLKSQFLANMSHELRTPLNSIIGFSRVILKGIDGPVTDLQQQDLTAIYNSGQHLLGLINDILDLSKIEAGKMELTLDEIDIEKLIKSVMSTVMGLIKDKPVRLEEEIVAELPPVRADSMRIRQILINLFSNAAKFTDEGTIKVTAVAEGDHVRIGVRDSGPGISKEDQEKLFQAFSQVDASATRATGGSGLGLSISKELVNMHDGEIGLISEVGKGSEFYFTLPFYESQESNLAIGNLKNQDGAPVILAIDDDEKVINLYQRYLNAQGYQVVALTDPKKAVERAKELKPYAITLDIMMPGYDGWQVLEDLKSDPETQHFPTIICSIIEDSQKGYSLGATDYLLKPILDDDLLSALNRLNDDGEIYDILLIDDNLDDLRLLEKLLLESKIYKPILAESGPAGWDMIISHPPQAVILDLFMPEMDGFEIMEAMQASNELREIPVIVISGGDLSATQQEKLDSLNLHLLQKGTLDSKELLTTLERNLNHLKISKEKGQK